MVQRSKKALEAEAKAGGRATGGDGRDAQLRGRHGRRPGLPGPTRLLVALDRWVFEHTSRVP